MDHTNMLKKGLDDDREIRGFKNEVQHIPAPAGAGGGPILGVSCIFWQYKKTKGRPPSPGD